ncbi:MAG: (Fe-S)-binding protein, partial [Candidatus Thorarchaeota archaeon]
MSSIWVRSLKSTPNFDCGLCGYQRCASFARAVVVEAVEIDTCPVLKQDEFTGLYGEFEFVLKRRTSLRTRISPELPEGGLLLTKPCKDTDEKVMAELRVYNGVQEGDEIQFGVFDPTLLCDFMDCLKSEFDLVKCSRDLGYGRADTGELSITILQDGRINMRRVDNKEHVLEVFDKIERSILGSIVCNCCGNDLISLMIDPNVRFDEHIAYDAGSRISVNKDIVKSPLGVTGFVSISDNKEIVDLFDKMHSQIVQLLSELAGHKKTVTFMSNLVEEIRCDLLFLSSRGEDDIINTQILKALGLLWTLESALIAIGEISVILGRIRSPKNQSAVDMVANLRDRVILV